MSRPQQRCHFFCKKILNMNNWVKSQKNCDSPAVPLYKTEILTLPISIRKHPTPDNVCYSLKAFYKVLYSSKAKFLLLIFNECQTAKGRIPARILSSPRALKGAFYGSMSPDGFFEFLLQAKVVYITEKVPLF